MTEFFINPFKPTRFPRIEDAVHLNLDRHVRIQAEEAARKTDELMRERIEEARQKPAYDGFLNDGFPSSVYREYQRKLDEEITNHIYAGIRDDVRGPSWSVNYYDDGIKIADEYDGVYTITDL